MTRATFELGGKLRAVRGELIDPKRILKQIGALVEAEGQAAFKDQAFDGKRWKPRAEINVYGILSDFAKGGVKQPPKRRFGDTDKTLMDTGDLKRSVVAGEPMGDMIEIGSKQRYASTHQFGGKIESVKITDDVRTGLMKWLNGQGKKYRSRLGWLLNRKFKGKKLEGEVPARPFVGITDTTRKNVADAVQVTLAEVR